MRSLWWRLSYSLYCTGIGIRRNPHWRRCPNRYGYVFFADRKLSKIVILGKNIHGSVFDVMRTCVHKNMLMSKTPTLATRSRLSINYRCKRELVDFLVGTVTTIFTLFVWMIDWILWIVQSARILSGLEDLKATMSILTLLKNHNNMMRYSLRNTNWFRRARLNNLRLIRYV
jgi:hypothetical protein